MINVTVTYVKTSSRGKDVEVVDSIEITGHANSGPYGQDLVCASVSSIITGAANAIWNNNCFQIILEEGHALIKRTSRPSGEIAFECHDDVTLSVTDVMLRTVAESNRKFIRITEKFN